MNLYEDYYLQDKGIFLLVEKYILENKKLPKGVSKKVFYENFMRIYKDPKKALNYFEKMNDFFSLVIPDHETLISFFNIFSTMAFDDFIRFYNVVKNLKEQHLSEFQDSLNDFVSLRVKNLQKEQFKNFNADEIEFYKKYIIENPTRANLIKLGDILFQRENYTESLKYYIDTLLIPQEPDKLYKSVLRKISQIYEINNEIIRSLYYLFLLHKTDESHQIATREINRLLKYHHLTNYFSELLEQVSLGEDTFILYLKKIFNERKIDIN
ncbi:hypothetical protein J7L48_01175 [bacterium]|nr:hypothetical protein [bacterium]